MTEMCYAWIRDIVFYFILVSVVMNVMPDSKYRKYVRFFLGIVLIILMVQPLLQFLNLSDSLDANFNSETLKQQWEESSGWINSESFSKK